MIFLKEVISHRKLHANLSSKKEQPPTQHYFLTDSESNTFSKEAHLSHYHKSDFAENSSDASIDTQPSKSLFSNMQPTPTHPTDNGIKRKKSR